MDFSLSDVNSILGDIKNLDSFQEEILQFKNIKLAIVKPNQHPPHIAFETNEFSKDDVVKLHRDKSRSCYRRDPSGNIYELIKYGD